MISFIALIIQLWLFAGITVMLHRINPRFGLTPLLFYVSAMVAMLSFVELFGLRIEPYPGMVIRPGAHIFVPVILLAVLTLYVADGTRIAQMTIAGLTGVNLLVLLVLFSLLIHLNVAAENTVVSGVLAQQNVIDMQFVRGVFAATLTFLADALVIAIFYQGIRNVFEAAPMGLVVSLALIAALWTDSILYNLLSNVGTGNFVLFLPGDVFAKTLSALMIAPIATYYLTRIVPTMPGYDDTRRPALDILFGAPDNLRLSLQQLQREHRESIRTYQQLTDNIDEVFWLATVGSGRFEYISPAFERMTGYKRERFYEHPEDLLSILHEEDQQRMPEGIIRHIYAVNDDEFRIRRQDDTYRWVRNRVFPIRNETGEVYRIAGIIEDITDRKQMAAQDFALALEREKVQMLQDFVRDSSHDLKSPLAVIMLKLSRLERAQDDAERLKHMQDIREYTQQLADMIDDLFTLSRLDGSEGTYTDSVDLSQLARHVYETLKPLAEDKGLDFVSQITPETTPVSGAADELERVLMNLVDNAIRYTLAGSVTLRVYDTSDCVCVDVQDTGIGIGQDELPQIFNRFYRAPTARSSGIVGTGLGLSIVKSIIEGHQGSIQVESSAGSGTTFLVQLPKTIASGM